MSAFIVYRPAALGGGGGGSSGVTSINTDGTPAQTLTVGTAGTNFAIVDAGSGSHVFNLPTASASNRGALSSADWSAFNGKQAAGNYLTALTGDGTAAGPGSSDLTLATVNSNTGAFGSASSVATFTVNGKGLTTAAGSTPIQIAESQVTNLVSDLAGKQATGNYATSGSGDVAWSAPSGAGPVTTSYSGTVPVGKGGTGTATAFTQGSVVFAGVSGVYTQDNANFFWDAGNHRLGIGSITPLSPLDVNGTGVTMNVNQYSAGATGASVNLQKSRGAAIGTQTVVQTGDLLGRITANGSDGTAFQTAGQVRVDVDASPSSGIVPGRLVLSTANSAGTLTDALRVDSAQNVVVGGSAAFALQGSVVCPLQLNSTGTVAMGHGSYSSTGSVGGLIYLSHSKSGTIGTQTAVGSGDRTGQIIMNGSDGTQLLASAGITAEVDAAVSTGIVPGRVLFRTTNGSGTLSEAARFDSNQNLITKGAQCNQSYDTSTATSGTITASANKPGLVVNSAGGTTLIVKLPSSPIDGQRYFAASVGNFTTVTWQDNGGTAGNVIGGQASWGGTARGQEFVYSAALTKWLSVS